MSLFQCQECGCCENTALSHWAYNKYCLKLDKELCSACDPSIAKWHGEFDRVFLPKGQFKTNNSGNLEHIATGREDFRSFAIDAPPYPTRWPMEDE